VLRIKGRERGGTGCWRKEKGPDHALDPIQGNPPEGNGEPLKGYFDQSIEWMQRGSLDRMWADQLGDTSRCPGEQWL